MSIKAKQPKPTPDDKPMDSIGTVIAAKKAKAQNNVINCPKCNRAFKKLDSLNTHVGKCNGKIGGGMPAGAQTQKTKELKAVKEAMQQTIASRVGEMLTHQFKQALGTSKLFMREKAPMGKLKRGNAERGNEQWTWKVTKVIDDADFMIYMSLEHDDRGAAKDDSTGVEYFWMEGKGGNYLALANLFDRAFGKPKENVELSEDPDAPVGVAGTGTTSAVRQMVLDTIREQLKKPRGGK